MSEPTIERPTASEAEALVDLWIELARGQRRYGSHLLAEANRTRIRESIVQQTVTDNTRVARIDDEFVGFVAFGSENEAYEQDVLRGFIHNVYVREPFRGRGIGSALLREAETVLAERGADAVALQVMARNEAARRFYRRHGYTPHRIEMEKPAESDTLTTDDE